MNSGKLRSYRARAGNAVFVAPARRFRMRSPLPTGIIPYTSRCTERSDFTVFEPCSVGRAGGYAIRRGVVAAGPARTRRGIRRGNSLVGRLIHCRVSPLAGGHGGVSRPTERELRAHRKGGVLRGSRSGSDHPDLEPRIPSVGSSIDWLRSIALLGVLVGFALYGAATLQARVLPRWCGVVFITAFPITAFLEAYGNIWFGLVWLALGYMLWSQRDTSVGQPSRVS
jgi:hypothetical protein